MEMTEETKDAEPRLLKLKSKFSVPPPGRFIFIDPEDHFENTGNTFAVLVQKSVSHRKANGIVVPDNFPEIIEDWICRQIPASFIKDAPKNYDTVKRIILTPTVVQKATKAVLYGWRDGGRRFVDKDELDRRIGVCSKCPMNVDSSSCKSCNGMFAWIEEWFGKSDEDAKKTLRICRVSGILNLSHVYVPVKGLEIATAQHMIAKHPEHCWKRQLLDQTPEKKNADTT